jgi:hypothetical protein
MHDAQRPTVVSPHELGHITADVMQVVYLICSGASTAPSVVLRPHALGARLSSIVVGVMPHITIGTTVCMHVSAALHICAAGSRSSSNIRAIMLMVQHISQGVQVIVIEKFLGWPVRLCA